jgi:hypothetical protein
MNTTDIVLAAFLRINGIRLISIKRNGTQGTFEFEEPPSLLVTEFDLGEARVEPRKLVQEIKNLTISARR